MANIIIFSNPEMGHLQTALHLVGYLKLRHHLTHPIMKQIIVIFWECDWTDFSEGAVKTIPLNAPLTRGKELDLHMLVDSNHAGGMQTRRSRTEFMMCMNMSLIDWYSKKQSTIETSVFDAEFVAKKVGVETCMPSNIN